MAWIISVPEESVYLSVLVLGELQKGIALLDEGSKREALLIWFEQLKARFAVKILPVDEEMALTWGKLVAGRTRAGRPSPSVDGLIAAMALRHGAILATRNTTDFANTGVSLVDPWV